MLAATRAGARRRLDPDFEALTPRQKSVLLHIHDTLLPDRYPEEWTWRGYNAMCRCPAHQDGTPSLSIRQGHDGILVHCFAGCTAEDVLREIARIRPGRTYDPPAEQRTGRPANIERLWNEGLPIAGTPAEAYLRFRGITGAFDDLSYHPRCPWGPKPHTRFLPALLIAAREGRTLRSIQRIFLDLAHGGYLDKATLGTPGGATWQGMRVTDTLALGEGFETSAAFTQIHGIPCWATLGAARLDRVHIPDSVTTLIFAEDNDFEGRRARRKAWAAYRPRGLTLKRIPPPSRYGDWADVVKPGA